MAPYLSRGPGFKTQFRGRLSSQQMVVYPTNRMGVVGAIHIDLKQKGKMFSLRKGNYVYRETNDSLISKMNFLLNI